MPKPPPNHDRMPGPWKLLGTACGIIGTFITAIFLWLNGSIGANTAEIAQVKADVVKESKDRAAGQAEQRNTATEIKGKVDKLESDVKRVQEDVKELKQSSDRNFEKVLEQLRQRGRTP